jgi:hypothetical protein
MIAIQIKGDSHQPFLGDTLIAFPTAPPINGNMGLGHRFGQFYLRISKKLTKCHFIVKNLLSYYLGG